MTDLLVLKNAVVFDGVSEELIEGASVVVENDRIREVAASGKVGVRNAETVDLGGRFLMPGLIDLHFHAYSVTLNIQQLDRMPGPLLVSHAARILEGVLQRGFTTVRDPGGGDIGLALAIEQGLIDGPRFFYGGKALSQTGGHGDMRPAHQEEPCHCTYSGVICQVVDGVEAVRRVCREELRKGADHIKVFISGGVASPTDPMWMPQFTDAEIRAAVEEAETRRKYVIAHCHTDEGARRCVRNGVRSIDHATEVTADTARLIAESGRTYIVPTLAVAHEITEHVKEIGLSPESQAKVGGVVERMLQSIENCTRAGVKIGLGTDLFDARYHPMQSKEFVYRAEVNRPIDILRSATSINAEIMQRPGELGCVAAGALADLIALDADPLKDLSVFQYPEKMPLIMKGGRMVRRAL